MENSLFFLYLWGKLELASIFLRKWMAGASFWAEQHLAWCPLPWPRDTSPVKNPLRMGLTGLRRKRDSADRSSGRDDFKLWLLEQRTKNPASTTGSWWKVSFSTHLVQCGTGKVWFQTRFSVESYKYETEKRVGGGALIESGGLSSFGLDSFVPEIPPKTQIFERAAGKPLERWK